MMSQTRQRIEKEKKDSHKKKNYSSPGEIYSQPRLVEEEEFFRYFPTNNNTTQDLKHRFNQLRQDFPLEKSSEDSKDLENLLDEDIKSSNAEPEPLNKSNTKINKSNTKNPKIELGQTIVELGKTLDVKSSQLKEENKQLRKVVLEHQKVILLLMGYNKQIVKKLDEHTYKIDDLTYKTHGTYHLDEIDPPSGCFNPFKCFY